MAAAAHGVWSGAPPDGRGLCAGTLSTADIRFVVRLVAAAAMCWCCGGQDAVAGRPVTAVAAAGVHRGDLHAVVGAGHRAPPTADAAGCTGWTTVSR